MGPLPKLLALTAAFAAASLPGAAAAGPAPSAADAQVTDHVFAEVNRERVRRGAPPLERPETLQRAAERRSRDVAALPHARRMNRTPRIDVFLANEGVTRYAFARERLLMLGGYDDAASAILASWQDYEDAWATVMSPALREAGFGWAHGDDGWSVFLAILVEPAREYGEDELRALELEAYRLVNEERSQRGLPPLAWNDALAAVARRHSAAMARESFFDHEDKQGRTPAQRVTAAGIEFAIVAENIATNRNHDEPAASAVVGWMESPGHRKNILMKRIDQTGLGVALAEDGALFFTQVFLRAPAQGAKRR